MEKKVKNKDIMKKLDELTSDDRYKTVEGFRKTKHEEWIEVPLDEIRTNINKTKFWILKK